MSLRQTDTLVVHNNFYRSNKILLTFGIIELLVHNRNPLTWVANDFHDNCSDVGCSTVEAVSMGVCSRSGWFEFCCLPRICFELRTNRIVIKDCVCDEGLDCGLELGNLVLGIHDMVDAAPS